MKGAWFAGPFVGGVIVYACVHVHVIWGDMCVQLGCQVWVCLMVLGVLPGACVSAVMNHWSQGICSLSRQVGEEEAESPHNVALEVVDDQREVGFEHRVAPGHQQLQRKDIALTLQELPNGFLGGQRGDSEPSLSEVGPDPSLDARLPAGQTGAGIRVLRSSVAGHR